MNSCGESQVVPLGTALLIMPADAYRSAEDFIGINGGLQP